MSKKMTIKSLALLSTLDVYKDLLVKVQDTKKKARIDMVRYEAVEARVPQVKEGRGTGYLRMKYRAKPVKAEPSIQAKLYSKEIEEKSYLQWVEAHSTRREIEEMWAQQFSTATMQLAEEGLAQASALLAEAVQGLRTRKYSTPVRTWADEVYPKSAK